MDIGRRLTRDLQLASSHKLIAWRTIGDDAFSVDAPRARNDLLANVISISLQTFKKKQLFNSSFNA